MTPVNKPNRHVLKAWAKAKRTGDTAAMAMLGREIDAYQAACSHPNEHRRTMTLRQDSSRKFKRGGEMCWCTVCNKVLNYVEPASVFDAIVG